MKNLDIKEVDVVYSETAVNEKLKQGYKILNTHFDQSTRAVVYVIYK